MKTLYRYEIQYSNADGDETSVNLIEHPIIKETKHTYFIKPTQYPVLSNKLKQVRKLGLNGNAEYSKRFAYETKNDALLNFKTRTKKRISWYKYWTDECKKALELIKD